MTTARLPLVFVAATLALVTAQPVAAQGFRLAERPTAIVRQLHARHLDLATGTDDQRRQLTRKVVEQLVYEFPLDGYGGKSADPGRPFSKDSIARLVQGELHGCDWQNGASREPYAVIPCEPIPGQNFIPVTGQNHLGSSTPIVPGPTVTPVAAPPVTSSDAALASFIEDVRASLGRVEQRLDALTQDHRAAETQRATDIERLVSVVRTLPPAQTPVDTPQGPPLRSLAAAQASPVWSVLKDLLLIAGPIISAYGVTR